MKLFQLIAEWRQRLGRARLFRDELDRGYAWLWEIRARILSFLLSRFQEPAESPEPGLTPELPIPHPPATYCIVRAADGPPPRSGEAIASILRDIRFCNRRMRSRWVLGLLPRIL